MNAPLTNVLINIRYKIHMRPVDFHRWTLEAAEPIPGNGNPLWQAWTYDGAVVAFETVEHAQTFLDGPILTALQDNPGVAQLDVRCEEIIAGGEITPYAPEPDELDLLVPYFLKY